MKKVIKITLITLGIALIALLAAFAIWAELLVGVADEAKSSLISDSRITVSDEGYLAFENVEKSEYGFIFYAGGRVEAEAYAPLARAITDKGINVFLPHFPLDLAMLGGDKAETIIKDHREIKVWFIGGHSLGGVMASDFFSKNDNLEGLIFLASYPMGDLSETPGKILSIYGSRDGLATVEKVEASKAILPDQTVYFEIKGGNHSQFGYYGFQKGDMEAEIPHDEQTRIVSERIVEFILEN